MHCRVVRYRHFSALFIIAAALFLAGQPALAMNEPEDSGAVYVLGNQSSGNTVIVFQRAEDGTLTRAQEVFTHGLGGSDLGSQGALALSGRLLFAVNAGSNELSVLEITEDGVRFVDKAASGGERPISVTVHGDIVYVLNAGGTSNVSGFRVTAFGKLRPISNSTRSLAGSAQASPAQVQFSPDGELLLVTEKGTGMIDVFAMGDEGRILAQAAEASNNQTPFGFSFGRGRTVVVSEAVGGAPGASTLSSYHVIDEDADSGDLKTISKSVPDTQTAACWVVITGNGKAAFTSNTGSGTISSFDVAPRGKLSLAASVAADLGAGSGPVDMALSRGSGFLYVLNSGFGTVTGFRVRGNHLIQVTNPGGLPATIQGIAAR